MTFRVIEIHQCLLVGLDARINTWLDHYNVQSAAGPVIYFKEWHVWRGIRVCRSAGQSAGQGSSGWQGEGFVKPSKKLRVGDRLPMEGGVVELELLDALGGGRWRMGVSSPGGDVLAALEQCGRAPLPPYIERPQDEDVVGDRARYQTVFAREPGAVAAPTLIRSRCRPRCRGRRWMISSPTGAAGVAGAGDFCRGVPRKARNHLGLPGQ